VGQCIKQLPEQLVSKRGIRNVANDPKGKEHKLVILSEGKSIETLPEEMREYVQSNGFEAVPHVLRLGYDHFNADFILKKVLPEGMEIPSSFETIGHIAHINLRDEHKGYEKMIGQVLLDKNPRLKTIVNKTNTIDTVFRVFKMEVIAGPDDLNAEVNESGCRFRFDFGKVYWNSRLQGEHRRLLNGLKEEDILCDMFAGVGPFAVPAAKKGCLVYANDLNPESYKAMCENAKLNKVDARLHAHNEDAREFVKQLALKGTRFTQVFMNLPASAAEFCDVFPEAFERYPHAMPTIHCYCFSKADDPKADAVKQVEAHMKMNISEDPELKLNVHDVRDVAPKKRMLCVSFVMPQPPKNSTSDSPRASKKPRVE